MTSFTEARLPEDLKDKIDVCIEDADYKELALHAELFIIGIFVVSSIVLPIFAQVIASYIKG